MSSPAGSIWFQGDWSDPWVEGLARALPRGPALRRIDAAAPWPGESIPPDLMILHRSRLLPGDADRFASRKQSTVWQAFPSTILCYGSFARYAELDRWLTLVDAAIPEATAADTLPRRIEERMGPGGIGPSTPRRNSPRVVVVSTNVDLRGTLADTCSEWVSRVCAVPEIRPDRPIRFDPELSTTGQGKIVTILDVLLLEPGWQLQLEAAAVLGPVIALLGFADRATVEMVRGLGARACLELPFDRDDLEYALQRCLTETEVVRPITHAGFEPAHRLPRPPTKHRGLNVRPPSRRET